MPNGDPRDKFFYPNLTLIIDSYIIWMWEEISLTNAFNKQDFLMRNKALQF